MPLRTGPMGPCELRYNGVLRSSLRQISREVTVFRPQFLQNPSRPRRSLSRSGRPPPRTHRTVRVPTRWTARADRVPHAIVLAPTPWRLGRRLSPRSPSSQTPARRRSRPRTAAPPDPSAAPGRSRYVARLFQPTHPTLFTELPVSGVLRSWTSALRRSRKLGWFQFGTFPEWSRVGTVCLRFRR
jgi:hypothetical protein